MLFSQSEAVGPMLGLGCSQGPVSVHVEPSQTERRGREEPVRHAPEEQRKSAASWGVGAGWSWLPGSPDGFPGVQVLCE